MLALMLASAYLWPAQRLACVQLNCLARAQRDNNQIQMDLDWRLIVSSVAFELILFSWAHLAHFPRHLWALDSRPGLELKSERTVTSRPSKATEFNQLFPPSTGLLEASQIFAASPSSLLSLGCGEVLLETFGSSRGWELPGGRNNEESPRDR